MFRVGQKVVCVDASGYEHLTEGHVYDVTRTNHLPTWININCCAMHANRDGAGWERSRFRPIVERKTDIGFAHEILRKTSRKQEVRA